MDATYRADLRELNEVNFARFDAKLEQRLAALKSDFEPRFSRIEAEFGVLRADYRGELKSLEARLVRWMFLFWAGTALAGLLFK